MRRLPVYLLVDTSGSMKGEPVEAVNNGVKSLVATLRQDPQALESVYISIIAFDATIKTVCELTALESFNPPAITTPDSGPTHLGEAINKVAQRRCGTSLNAALSTLMNEIDAHVVPVSSTQGSDWKPIEGVNLSKNLPTGAVSPTKTDASPPAVDDRLAVFVARCQHTESPYLMRFERQGPPGNESHYAPRQTLP